MFSSLTCEAVNSGWTGSSCSFWHDGFLWGPLCEDSISYISLSVTYEGPAWLNNDLRMIWFTCKQRKAWVERCTWIDNITGEINHKRWLNTGERIDLSIALQQHYSVNTQLKHLVRFFVSTLEATMDRGKKKVFKKGFNAILAYVCHLPQMHFWLCSTTEWDLATFHPANGPIIFASHPPVTLNKQNLSMSNSLVCVVPYFTSLLVVAIPPPPPPPT